MTGGGAAAAAEHGTAGARPRVAVVVTGSELVRGERVDRNGPFLAAEALREGLEPARITIVGDAPAELEAALREALQADACLVSGGLGPTHDDRTVELLARAAGLELVVDEALERRIEAASRAVAQRLRRPYADYAPGVRKQATRPVSAVPVGLAGTAPALVLRAPTGCVAVLLPGPPEELRRLWPQARASEPFRELLTRARPRGRRVLRFFGTSESEVARALEAAGGDGGGVEATICARELEIHVDLLAEPEASERADALEAALAARLEPWLFARDERPVEELVLALLQARGLQAATAESCTGGMVAARLTSVAGASASFVGGVVAYADELKRRELGVPGELLAEHGAVSAEVAAAMAEGARRRLGADVAVAVTGVAGPAGGTREKPVGRVHLHASGPDGSLARRLDLPGSREQVRARATVAALHLLRALLTGSRDEPV
ncbi:MAG TPA: nicotinamide-nucleotide amidohydrolase family protein [Gaiellaceae bacterium]|nr:nicotinamide-nucleotide amidohydrolase family protein [Gaiellaceae bacterium]